MRNGHWNNTWYLEFFWLQVFNLIKPIAKGWDWKECNEGNSLCISLLLSYVCYGCCSFGYSSCYGSFQLKYVWSWWSTLGAGKFIFRYLIGTQRKSVCCWQVAVGQQSYYDANMAGYIDTRKSTNGYVFTVAGWAVSWFCRLWKILRWSAIEVEYMLAEAPKEAPKANLLKILHVKLWKMAIESTTSICSALNPRQALKRWMDVCDLINSNKNSSTMIIDSLMHK